MVAMLFNEYTFLLWWVALMAVASQFLPVMTTVDVMGQRVRRVNLFFAVAVFFPIFRLAAFGPLIGDVWNYLSSYSKMPDGLSEFTESLKEMQSGYGYDVIEYLIKRLSGGDRTAYRVTIALIHSIPVVLILRKYSENYLLSVFLFVTGTYHIAWMMNGLRQFVAVVMIFAAFPLMLKRRYALLIPIILMATLVHFSALLMLPVVFVVQGKAWNWKTLLSILVASLAVIVFQRRYEVFETLFENTEYGESIVNFRAAGDDGANPLRVLVSAVPVVIAFVGRKYLPKDDLTINVCVNMAIVTMCIYLIAMVTSGVLVGRLPVYTSLYSLILYPCLIRHIFTENSQRIITFIMIVFYLVWYLYSMG